MGSPVSWCFPEEAP
jgi:hypothetical protein